MTALSNIITVNVSRQTSSVSRASFGTPAILAQFTSAKTTTPFTERFRLYGSLTELAADGWSATDSVYKAAAKLLGQSRKVSKFMVGRINSTDANITTSLDAIQLEYADWYGFGIVGTMAAASTFSATLVTGNVINMVVAGKTVASQTFATDHVTTMTQLAAKIVTALTETGYATPTALASTNTITITQAGRQIDSVSAVVTSGATQPTLSTVYTLPKQGVLDAAAWTAGRTKVFGYADTDVAILNPAATTDLAYQLKALAYDRTWGIYHATPSDYINFAWMGLELAKDPGKSTWAHKSLQGVTPDNLTEGQNSATLAKNGNTYTPISGTGRTLNGKSASGENIFVVRNIDYATSEIQSDGADFKFALDIVPANDKGIAAEENVLKGTLARMEDEGVFIPGTSTTTSTKYADWSSSDKSAGTNRMTFASNIQGAILKTIIEGTVTY